MRVARKDATITNVSPDDSFPGEFEVILSAPTKDRDGDTLLSDDWKLPLPDHITFDQDHGMSVASTVGSGVPTIDPETGNLIVRGTYSSLDRAQEVRTLVNEGHIKTTSVAFMTEKQATKDGKSRNVRELLNGAFVAIPSNREALVMTSKAATAKAGARNSASDMETLQQIHDSAASLGADCSSSGVATADGKSFRNVKSVVGSYESAQSAISDALSVMYAGDPDVYAYPSSTFDDTVVYNVYGGENAGQWQAPYTLNDDGTVTLGLPEPVTTVEQIVPKSLIKKDADTDTDDDAGNLAAATDAAIDEAIDLFNEVDITSLPDEVQQAIALVQAADLSVDKLLEVLGVPDPDEQDANTDAGNDVATPAAGATAPAAGEAKSFPVEDDAAALALRAKSIELMLAAQFIN